MTDTALLAEGQLTVRQQERRERVLAAATELAHEGGYDAVQMREVARRAEVALGTVYNYFSSKDHLLAAGMVEWVDLLEVAVRSQALIGATPQERVSEVLGRAISAMAVAPDITKAMVTALNSPGVEVAECKEALSVIMHRIIGDAIGEGWPLSDRHVMARSIEHVWYSTLLAWVNLWMDVDGVRRELLDAARLIVPR